MKYRRKFSRKEIMKFCATDWWLIAVSQMSFAKAFRTKARLSLTGGSEDRRSSQSVSTAQTPPLRLAVDLLYNMLYKQQVVWHKSASSRRSTTNPEHPNMSRCCRTCCTTNPQQIEANGGRAYSSTVSIHLFIACGP